MKNVRKDRRTELEVLGFDPERQAAAQAKRRLLTTCFLAGKIATLGTAFLLALFSQRTLEGILAVIPLRWLAVLIFSYLILAVSHLPLLFFLWLRDRWFERGSVGTKTRLVFGRALSRYLLVMLISLPFFAWLYGMSFDPWKRTGWNPIFYVVMLGSIELLLVTFSQSRRIRKPDEELLARAKRIAERLRMKPPRIRELTGPKVPLGGAAYVLIGFWEAILVSENIRKMLSERELDGVLAHELAHRREGWGLAFALAPRFFLPVLIEGFLRRPLASLYGLDQFGIAFLPLFIVLCELGIFLALPLENAIRRWLERRADQLALKVTGDADAFASAMTKLYDSNLVDAAPGRLWQLVFGSHPTGVERVIRAKNNSMG